MGCAVTNDGGQFLSDAGRKFDQVVGGHELRKNLDSAQAGDIANPPAKSIRFEGQETILGLHRLTRIAERDFTQQLASLLKKKKHKTATHFVATHIETATQLLWLQWAAEENSEQLRFMAKVVSRDRGPGVSWLTMLDFAEKNRPAALRYGAARKDFQARLESNEPMEGRGDALRQAADVIRHPLAQIDTFCLMGLHESTLGRHSWAESLFLQAIALAEKHQDNYRAADLRLLLSVDAVRSRDGATDAAATWESALTQHARTQLATGRPIRTPFWIRAGECKPADAKWPNVVQEALLPFAKPLGCRFEGNSSTEMIVWSAVGNAELDAGKPQLALIHFKKAEAFARHEDKLWFRIAQSECLASLGQTQTASAVLAGPLASKNATLAAAANAALGGAKLQNGAFQQGARLLHRALLNPSLDWPKRTKAEADLALAQLVMGQTARGLEALHAVQRKFEIHGDEHALIQSLENELGLLEHEQKSEAHATVRDLLIELEKQ